MSDRKSWRAHFEAHILDGGRHKPWQLKRRADDTYTLLWVQKRWADWCAAWDILYNAPE